MLLERKLMPWHRLVVDQLFNEIEKENDFIHKKGITKKKWSPLKPIYWLGTSTLPPVGA
jgi:hypothetical protein